MAKKQIGEIFRFNVIVPLWLIAILVFIVTIASYFYFPNNRDDVKFIATLIGCTAAIYSAYYGGIALRRQNEREKQKSSFEILSLLNRPEFVEVRKFIETEVKEPEKISDTDLYKKIKNDSKLENAVTIVLGILEDASIAIQEEYTCENCLYKSIYKIALINFKGLKGFIDQVRIQDHDPKFYIELERLCNSWESGKRLSDGKPVPP
jgi:hypothetical protein